MKTLISAGGIVVRKRRNDWEVLVLQDMNGAWTFPKGLIEKGEGALKAAKREIGEEVGISDITKVAALAPIRYIFRKNGLISKTVRYFLFTSQGKETPVAQKEEGIQAVQWMRIDKAIEIIGYEKTNKPLLLKVQQWILNSPLT